MNCAAFHQDTDDAPHIDGRENAKPKDRQPQRPFFQEIIVPNPNDRADDGEETQQQDILQIEGDRGQQKREMADYIDKCQFHDGNSKKQPHSNYSAKTLAAEFPEVGDGVETFEPLDYREQFFRGRPAEWINKIKKLPF